MTKKFGADIFGGLFMKETNEGISISSAVATMLGERGLKLNLDIYGGDGDE